MRILHLAWVVPLALCLGWLTGRRLGARETARPEAEREAPVAARAAPALAVTDGRLVELLARRAELEKRLSAALAAVPRAKSAEERLAMARSVADVLSGVPGATVASIAEASRHLPELGPDVAHVFIEMLEKPQGIYQVDSLIRCVFDCGGPDAAAFLLRVLADGGADGENSDLRVGVIQALENVTAYRLNLDRIPVDGELRELAVQLTRAPDSRRGIGATLLGGSPTAETRELLERMACTDPDSSNRAHAFFALGECGDATTLAWLESLGKHEVAAPHEEFYGELEREGAQAAILRLKRKAGR